MTAGVCMEKLDQICKKFEETYQVKAMAVSIHHHDRYVYTYHAGAKADTLFSVGSISKIITTVAVLKLVEQGKVELDAPVTQYLKELHIPDERAEKLCVSMLLDHSCGLAGNCYQGKYGNAVNRSHLQQCIAYANQVRLKDTPGMCSTYCNDGFSLAEALIEAVSGQTYAQFITEEILRPCEMKHTDFPLHSLQEGKFLHADSGFDFDYPQEYVNGIGSGGIYSTAEDICRFYDHLMQGNLLHPATLALMNTKHAADNCGISAYSDARYGFGWDDVENPLFCQYGLTACEKSGGTFGFSSHSILLLKEQFSCAVTLCTQKGSPTLLNEELALAYLSETMSLVKRPVSNSLPKPCDMRKWEGVYAYNKGILRLRKEMDHYVLELDENGTWVRAEKLHTDRSGALVSESGSLLRHHDAQLWLTAADAHVYMVLVTPHPLDSALKRRFVYAEQLIPGEAKKTKWQRLDGHLYLQDDEWLFQRKFAHQPLLIRPHHLEGYGGYLCLTHPLWERNEREAVNTLRFPGTNAAEIGNLLWINEKELQYGMYHYRCADALPLLEEGEYRFRDAKVHWYRITASFEQLTCYGNARMILLDEKGNVLFDSIYMNGIHDVETACYAGIIMDEKAMVKVQLQGVDDTIKKN